VRARYDKLVQEQHKETLAVPAWLEDEDDYEPDYEPIEDPEQIRIGLEVDSAIDSGAPRMNLGPFSLPAPQPLSKPDLDKLYQATIDRVFRRIDQHAPATATKTQKSGFNRLAASSNDRQAMLTTFIRLVTRPSAGLTTDAELKQSGMEGDGVSAVPLSTMADGGRLHLLHYILNNWTQRMDVATAWLTEEWYNDMTCKQHFDEAAAAAVEGKGEFVGNFSKWTHRFLDELSAFISHEHQNLLIRFVSEVPGLDADIINKIKRLALDPERVGMTIKSI
jgi:symplekin